MQGDDGGLHIGAGAREATSSGALASAAIKNDLPKQGYVIFEVGAEYKLTKIVENENYAKEERF